MNNHTHLVGKTFEASCHMVEFEENRVVCFEESLTKVPKQKMCIFYIPKSILFLVISSLSLPS
jgi:hypothetical protein